MKAPQKLGGFFCPDTYKNRGSPTDIDLNPLILPPRELGFDDPIREQKQIIIRL
jgi:hypothetical protein